MTARLRAPLYGLALAGLLAACDATVDVSQNTALTTAEAQMAAEVVAQSMADQSEGMVSDLYDMDAGLDASGLRYHEGPLVRGGGRFRVELGRPGEKQDGRVRYDSTTGTHYVEYERHQEQPFRETDATLAYVFTDAGGAFLRYPSRDRDRIAAVTFQGEREGEARVRTPGGREVRTTFTRNAAWKLSGLATTTATFQGDQYSTGTRRVMGTDSTETFSVRLRTDGVTIPRTRATQGIELALTGTLQYEVVVKRAGQGETRSTGSIDLAQDGKGLLRFTGLSAQFRVDLGAGTAQRTN